MTQSPSPMKWIRHTTITASGTSYRSRSLTPLPPNCGSWRYSSPRLGCFPCSSSPKSCYPPCVGRRRRSVVCHHRRNTSGRECYRWSQRQARRRCRAQTVASWNADEDADFRSNNELALWLLLGPAGVYAAISIVNSLLMGSIVRRQEYQAARLLGATAGQVRRMVMCESGDLRDCRADVRAGDYRRGGVGCPTCICRWPCDHVDNGAVGIVDWPGHWVSRVSYRCRLDPGRHHPTPDASRGHRR